MSEPVTEAEITVQDLRWDAFLDHPRVRPVDRAFALEWLNDATREIREEAQAAALASRDEEFTRCNYVACDIPKHEHWHRALATGESE